MGTQPQFDYPFDGPINDAQGIAQGRLSIEGVLGAWNRINLLTP